MPEVVQAGARVIGRLPEARFPRKTPKHPIDVLKQQPATSFRHKEERASGTRNVDIALFCILRQAADSGGMERHQTRLPELRRTNGEDTSFKIDIIAAKRKRLTDPQTCDGQQSQQVVIRPAAQRISWR
jgi:hypothetical protein